MVSSLEAMTSRGKVVYVDGGAPGDDPVFDSVVRAGGETVRASTAREARALCEAGPPDLLVVRHREERAGARDIIESLRDVLSCPVLVISARDDSECEGWGVPSVDLIPAGSSPAYVENRVRYNLELRRVLRTAEERSLKLSSIIDISETINQTFDAGRILYNIARKLSEVMDLVRCSFILPDMTRKRGQVLACKDDPNISNLEIDLTNYPEILKALDTGKPVMIDDVAHDPLMADALWVKQNLVDQSILTLPLVSKGTVIGILQIRKKGGHKGFDVQEVEFCHLIANAAAIALKNTQLYEGIEKRNATLTEQKTTLEHLSAELTRKNGELLELHEFKEEFAAMIVHDLRSPMTTIRGALEILGGANPSPAQRKTLIEDALDESARILEMINNLLEISKIERGEIKLARERLPVESFLTEVVEPLRILAEKRGITLAIGVADDVPAVEADPAKLRQVFTNLVNNAIDHTPAGGRIEVSAERAANGAEAVVFRVQDTGCGMPPEILPRIFDMFTHFDAGTPVERMHRGTGLGLAIVKLFTEAHRGTVAVQSTPRQGSLFTVTLPVEFETG